MRGTLGVALILSMVLVITAFACGGAEETTPAAPAPSGQTTAPAPAAQPATAAPVAMELSGTIEIDGSSTVFPVSEAVAEEFGKLHSDVRVNVGVSGTGGGFKRFTVGEIDISDASRPIKDAEAQQSQPTTASNTTRSVWRWTACPLWSAPRTTSWSACQPTS